MTCAHPHRRADDACIRPARETGSTLVAVIFAIIVLTLMVAWVASSVRGSNTLGQRSTEESLSDATSSGAAELYRVALDQGLASESTGYLLDRSALQLLLARRPHAEVVANAETSDRWGLDRVRVPDAAAFAVRDRSGSADQYWQVYEVLEPRRRTGSTSNLVVFVRSWNTIPAAKGTVKVVDRKVARIEYTTSSIADGGLRTDAPIHTVEQARWFIDGPIHSNGHTSAAGTSGAAPPGAGSGVALGSTTRCGPRASIRTGGGATATAAEASCAAALGAAGSGGRDLNILELDGSLGRMLQLCAAPRPDVLCLDTGADAASPPASGSHDVVLGQGQVVVDGQAHALVDDVHNGDSTSLTIVTTRDVVLHGTLRAASDRFARVTIAALGETGDAGPPRVTLVGDLDAGAVGADDPATTAVGVVSRGDIVLGLRDRGCISSVRGVLLAQSGSVTVPPEYVTATPPAVDSSQLSCSEPIRFEGSITSHGPFMPIVAWDEPEPTSIGYGDVVVRHQPALLASGPPHLPVIRPWGIATIANATDRCLAAVEMSPTCT